MTDTVDLTTPGAWRQTESLTLLRRVMSLEAAVRHQVMQATGLSDTEVHALEHLARAPLGPAEIARLLDVSTAASTGIVDRLEAKGHVERRPHARDRRRTEVLITASARREVLSHLGAMFQDLARLDASLAEHERDAVVRYLRGAIAASGRVIGDNELDPAPGEHAGDDSATGIRTGSSE